MIEWLSRKLGRDSGVAGEVPVTEPVPEIEEVREAHDHAMARSETALGRFHDLEAWLAGGGEQRRVKVRHHRPERRGT
jgi:hypothetical protein